MINDKPVIYLSGKLSEDKGGRKVSSKSVLSMKVLLEKLGAQVFIVDHEKASPENLRGADGVVFMGNDNDIDPARYGAENNPKTKSENAPENYKTNRDYELGLARANYEYEAMQTALNNNIPIFGVCGGMQRLNVLRGGTLIQHLEDQAQTEPPNITVDAVKITQGTLLEKIANGQTGFMKPMKFQGDLINSFHHQAVAVVGEGLRPSSVSLRNGTIEALESSDPKQFILCTQWHPEFLPDSPLTNRMLGSFVEAAKTREINRELGINFNLMDLIKHHSISVGR